MVMRRKLKMGGKYNIMVWKDDMYTIQTEIGAVNGLVRDRPFTAPFSVQMVY